VGKHIFWICLIITAAIAGTVHFLSRPVSQPQVAAAPSRQSVPPKQLPVPEIPEPVTSTPAPQVSSELIYKWVDDKGVTHYSDLPAAAAEQVALKPLNVVSIPAAEQARIDERRRQQTAAYLASTQVQPKVVSVPASRKSGYVVERASAEQKPKHVELTGRISGGPMCRNLRLSSWAKSDRNGSVYTWTDVTNAGGDFGSRLFEAKPDKYWNGTYPKPAWEISRIDFACLD